MAETPSSHFKLPVSLKKELQREAVKKNKTMTDILCEILMERYHKFVRK
jgi:hypothetical protein